MNPTSSPRTHVSYVQNAAAYDRLDGLAYERILEPTCNMRLARIQGGLPTTVRVLPVPYADGDREPMPFRISPAPNALGGWMYVGVGVTFYGHLKASFIMAPCTAHMTPSEIAELPVRLIWRRVQRSKRDLDRYWGEWRELISASQGGERRSSGKDDYPVVRDMETLAFLQVAILREFPSVKGKAVQEKVYRPPSGLGDRDRLNVLQLSQSARVALQVACNEPSKDYQGDPEDYDRAFLHGDLVSLDKGRFVTFYQGQYGHMVSANGQAPPARQASSDYFQPSQEGDPAGGEKKGFDTAAISYQVQIEKSFRGFSSTWVRPDVTRKIHERIKPWEEVIHVSSTEEQVLLLCETGMLPVDLVVQALDDHYHHFIPQKVRDLALAPRRHVRAHPEEAREDYDPYPPARPPERRLPGQGYPEGRQGSHQGGYREPPAEDYAADHYDAPPPPRRSPPQVPARSESYDGGGYGDAPPRRLGPPPERAPRQGTSSEVRDDRRLPAPSRPGQVPPRPATSRYTEQDWEEPGPAGVAARPTPRDHQVPGHGSSLEDYPVDYDPQDFAGDPSEVTPGPVDEPLDPTLEAPGWQPDGEPDQPVEGHRVLPGEPLEAREAEPLTERTRQASADAIQEARRRAAQQRSQQPPR